MVVFGTDPHQELAGIDLRQGDTAQSVVHSFQRAFTGLTLAGRLLHGRHIGAFQPQRYSMLAGISLCGRAEIEIDRVHADIP